MGSVGFGGPRVFGAFASISLVTILVTFAGCSDTPYEIVPISGKITYDDESVIPAETVLVWFYPQAASLESNVHARPGLTQLNSKDGSFAYVSTCEHADGVILGRHKVVVKVGGESRTGAGSIPAVYADPATTPLEIEVTGKGQEYKLRIEKPTRAAPRK